MDPRRFGWLLSLLLCAFALCALAGCRRASSSRVVLYCAQDKEFAEGLLNEFQQKTGVPVAPKYDTEAKKSVTHYTEIVSEQERPRCDVFWNNEILSTIRLQRQGLLEAYDSPAAAPYPNSAKAKDHTWCSFASRARVLLVNTRLVKEADRPRSLLDLAKPQWKDRVVMAQPQFGTSATQAACLFEVLGAEKAKAFYLDLKKNNVQISPGNKQVAEWVGRGRTPAGQVVAVGVTDTDDAMEEIQANHEVALIFPDRDAQEGRLGTLFIPNTVAILKGCPNPAGARRLVDFLLSADVEAQLATAASHQIPLNPQVKAELPPQILLPGEGPGKAHAMQVDFYKAATLWNDAQKFLEAEFAAP